MRFYNIIQNYKWGVWLAIPIAIFILYFFPNDSETVPKFCSFGINKNNLPLVHRKSTLHLTTFNAEWLFDGINDPHRSFETADTHMNNIGKWLQSLHADVINIVELEDCRVLSRIKDEYLPNHGVYVQSSKDTANKQTTGLLTKLPLSSPGMMFSNERMEYPVSKSSKCGYKGKSKTTGVSKHWYGTINTETVGEILLIGVHFKARPNDPKSCSKREAQASVLIKLIKQHRKNKHVIFMGDLNDFDPNVLDASSNLPKSNVLSMLKTELSLTNVWKYVKEPRDRWSYRDPNTKWPDSALDHILISKELEPYIEDVWVDRNASFSDHRPLSLRFRWKSD